jgi:tRNA nucleotidyltransferase/poly(A) polymerase
MVMDESGGVLDFFGGRADIENKLVRCVGDADTRFTEDSLRILRALRFASVLNFKIEADTARSIHANKGRLKLVSKERVWVELAKLLMGDGVGRVLLEYADVLAEIMPPVQKMRGFEQHNHHHVYDVWGHTAHAVAAAEKDLLVRLTMLFHDMGKPRCFHLDEKGIGHFYGHAEISAKMAEETMRDLRVDNKTAQAVYELVRYHDRPMQSKKSVKRCLRLIGAELFDKLLYVQAADDAAKSPKKMEQMKTENRALRAVYEEILQQAECFSLKDLAVSGKDLTALGYKGKACGEALNRLLDLVIDGRTENTREALLERLI